MIHVLPTIPAERFLVSSFFIEILLDCLEMEAGRMK